ncbi:unnamed protein product, partial [Allacma fusca]
FLNGRIIFSNLWLCETPTCAITLANYSKSTLFSPLYYVPPNCGTKRRLPPLIGSDRIEAICFQGFGGSCEFLWSYAIGTTLLRLTIISRIHSNGYCVLGFGFSPRDLPVDASLYSVLTQYSNLPDHWVLCGRSKSPVEIFSNQGSFFDPYLALSELSSNFAVTLDNFRRVSSLVGSSDVFTCVMEVVNCLDVSLKLRGCRSFECSRMLAEVPPLGTEIFIATSKTGIEAAFAYEIEGTDLGFLAEICTR